ncbi:hypothetical protein [Pseudomonas citronellolis]|uniref:hypothetical protein n=1 Tax=Pseudomonas citronellolis TaxID=53408 RepID=UPI00128EE795|nr:hypothetical protein [Pseudomonas citronellolis]
MHNTKAHELSWIKESNLEQLKWAVSYIRKKAPYNFTDPNIDNMTIYKINFHLTQTMEGSQRKLFIINMRNAWRAKISRKNRKSNSAAFQVYLPKQVIKEINSRSKAKKIKNAEYIEILVKNEMESYRRHQEISRHNKKITKDTLEYFKYENTTLKIKLKEAHTQIENLNKTIEELRKNPETKKSFSPFDAADLGIIE